MKAKKVLAAGVLCALAIGLTACGGGSAVPGSPQDKTSPVSDYAYISLI